MLPTLEQVFPIGCLEPFQTLLTELSVLVPGESVTFQSAELVTGLESAAQINPPVGLWVSEYASLVLDKIHHDGADWIQATVNDTALDARLRILQSHAQGSLAVQLGQAIALHALHQTSPTTQVTQTLLENLLQKTADGCRDGAPTVAACQPIVDAAMTQQLAQDGLIHRVTAQIRQSLELPKILSTAATQVRQILDVDRFVVYQFEPKPKHNGIQPLRQVTAEEGDHDDPTQSTSTPQQSEIPRSDCMGTVTYESCRDQTIDSTLNYSEQYCWSPTGEAVQRFKLGETLAVSDVETTYADSDCMCSFLRAMQVQAKLVVPVLVQSELWGLLIAHQCSAPRHWDNNEVNFLQQIAGHLSVAIAQSQLYHQLHQQPK